MHANRWSAVLTASLVLGGSTAIAQGQLAAPTADELKKVIDYYYQGKDQGPILVQLTPCLKVDSSKDTAKDSATRNECIEPVSGPVKKGTTVSGWMLWFVPDGAKYDDVALQFLHEGQVRTTVDLPLQTSLRSRTWRQSTLTKAGKWEIKVVRAGAELGSVTVTVEP